jgi:hypothetical protein
MDGWRDKPQNGHPHGEIVGQTNALTDRLTINFKLARFAAKQSKCVTIIRPLLALKMTVYNYLLADRFCCLQTIDYQELYETNHL